MFNTTEYIKELEIQLYNTRKALDVAVESLEMIKHNESTIWNVNYKAPVEIVEKALKEINEIIKGKEQ